MKMPTSIAITQTTKYTEIEQQPVTHPDTWSWLQSFVPAHTAADPSSENLIGNATTGFIVLAARSAPTDE
jgi:hypothetical protein